ncbi:MAG TPA: hypothetical protein VGF94_19895 [Kofleriaceae bacterium]|jgi:hypothetical protein
MRELVVVVVLVASSAWARPLPKGLAISFKDQTLYAARDGMVVKVFDDDVAVREEIDGLTSAELSADGTLVVLHVDKACAGASVTNVRLASIDARFENVRGMQQLAKNKHDDAITHFNAAVTADDADLFVTNLLSAQALGKQFDDADRTIARYAPKRRAWFAWRLAVDPDLAALRGRASAKSYVTAPSKLASSAFDGDAVAVSPLGLVAMHEDNITGIPTPDTDFALAIYTPGAFEEPLRITAVPSNTRPVDRALAAMGFEKRAVTWVESSNVATSPDKTTSVTFDDSGATVKRGKTSVHVANYDSVRRVGFAGDLVIIQTYEHLSQCSGDIQQFFAKIVQLK